MAHQRAAGRPCGQARDRAGRPGRPPRRPAAGTDGQLPGGPDHVHRGVARRSGGHPAALPGQRGRARARAERLRRGRRRHHGGVPAEGLRRREGGPRSPVRAGPRGAGRGTCGSRDSGARLRPGGLGRAGVHHRPVGHRPGRPAVHRWHDGPVEGRPAHPRGPVLVRAGRPRAVGPRQRGQLSAAAAPRARLRLAGHMRRHAPDGPHEDHPDALVRPGRLGEAGRGAPGAEQCAGAFDDPDAAQPAP